MLLTAISPANANRLAQLAHWGSGAEVSQIAYSPDGRLLAVGTYAGIELLDGQTGAKVHSIEVPAWSVAFSPDGAMLASGWQDGLLQLWRVDGCAGSAGEAIRGGEEGCGSLLQTLAGHTGEIWDVAFSPDGHFLASGSHDETVRLWRVGGCRSQIERRALGGEEGCGQHVHTLEGHDFSIEGVAFSPDGTIVASGSWDGTVRLWQVSTGRLLHTLEGVDGSVTSLAFRPATGDGSTGETMLAAGMSDGSVRLWQMDEGVTLWKTLTGHYGRVNSVAFSPDGTILASAGDYLDQNVQLWQLGDRANLLNVLRQHNGAVLSLSFWPDGTILAAAGGQPDNGVRLWGLAED